ncbi:MAG TPA: acyl-CoA dehydrogenase family protein [Alphaproteobacteria bacterium]|nr:acyl-CoA dehydrogenase family protein [Alphaproteobacteria bacterium]
MDWSWSEEHRAFRQKIRDVLKKHLPADWESKSKLDTSSAYMSRFSREFCPILAREGLLIPHWPKEYGGGDVDAYHHWILGEEMFAVGDPRSYQYMNVNWVGPAILRYGTEAQKHAHIGRIAAGTHIWCQGFSEPSAGSDLASLTTRAERTADGYVIDGMKIWTSGASLADYCFMLARTGGTRHEGISVFLVPMDTHGVRAKPIPNLMGEFSLHETVFDRVAVPESARLGDEDQGWSIVRQVMHNERIGQPRYTLSMRALDRAVARLKDKGRFGGQSVRADAGRAHAALSAAQSLALKVIDGRVKGHPPDALTSVARYALVAADRQVADFLGAYLSDDLMAAADPLISAAYRRTGSTGIAAGAAEIQLNLVARDHLQLPKG